MKYYMVSTVGSIEVKNIESVGKFNAAVKTLKLLLPVVSLFKRQRLSVTVIGSDMSLSNSAYMMVIVHEGNEINDIDRNLAKKLVKTLRTISGLVKE